MRLIMVSRKSTSCLVGRCRTQTRMKWKTSFWLWNRKRMPCLLCPMPLHRSRNLCLAFQQTILSERENGKSKEHSSDVLKKPWRHERLTSAVLTGRGGLFESRHVLIHDTHTIGQKKSLITRQIADLREWPILCVGNNLHMGTHPPKIHVI
jgi:hypothetical protein